MILWGSGEGTYVVGAKYSAVASALVLQGSQNTVGKALEKFV
jgi:hypothetical protein